MISVRRSPARSCSSEWLPSTIGRSRMSSPGHPVVVQPGLQPVDLVHDHVGLDRIEGAGGGRGAVEVLALRGDERAVMPAEDQSSRDSSRRVRGVAPKERTVRRRPTQREARRGPALVGRRRRRRAGRTPGHSCRTCRAAACSASRAPRCSSIESLSIGRLFLKSPSWMLPLSALLPRYPLLRSGSLAERARPVACRSDARLIVYIYGKVPI